MADNKGKESFRNIVKTHPLWGKAADAMTKVLFPKSFDPKIGVAKHARLILWALTEFKNVLIQLPRYHGKSTYVTFLYVMYVILTRKKKFILIVSSTGNQAVKFLSRIRRYLTSSKVRHYYGDLASGMVDGAQSFDYVDSADGKKRSTSWNYKELLIEPWGIRIMATSISSANRGLLSDDQRYDLCILDDIEDKKNTNTPELRDKLSDIIVEELFPGGDKSCQYVIIGTICHYGSFLLKLRELGDRDGWFFAPLTRATDTIENIRKLNDLLPDYFPDEYKFDPQPEYFTKDTVDMDGKKRKKGEQTPEVSIWQGMYNYEFFLAKLKDYVALGKKPSFWQEYYNIPKSSEDKVFTEFQYVEDIRFKYFLGEPVLESTGNFIFPNGRKIINVNTFLGGDLAVSPRESADWRVFITVFTDHFRNVYVLPPYKSKEPDPFVIARWVLDRNKEYQYNGSTFDGQHFQKWFSNILQYLEKNEDEYSGYRLTPIYQKARSEDKISVITGTLAPLIPTGKMYFLGDPENFKLLQKELTELGYCGSDDHADALTYACSNLKYPDLIDLDRLHPLAATLEGSWMKELEDSGIPESEFWKYV